MLLPALPSASGPFVGPGDRYPNRQLKTKSVPVWLLADSQPHSLHSLKRFFWRRSIVINHFGSKGASPALPSAPPCTEARRGPILARKRWASGIAASTLSSSGAGPNPCSPTTKPEFPKKMGFVLPLARWLSGDLKELLCDTLSSDRLRRSGYFDPVAVEHLISSHLARREDHGKTLWSLLVFQLWLDRYAPGQASS